MNVFGSNQEIVYSKENLNSILASPNCSLEKLLNNEHILIELQFNQNLQNLLNNLALSTKNVESWLNIQQFYLMKGILQMQNFFILLLQVKYYLWESRNLIIVFLKQKFKILF